MNDKAPIGERFSRVYLEKGPPLEDSPRMRFRIRSYFFDISTHILNHDKLAEEIHKHLGVEVPVHEFGVRIGECSYNIGKFLDKAEVRDFLDTITIVWEMTHKMSRLSAEKWKATVAQVFIEENIGYRIDDRGGVHPLVDEEFERNRVSVLDCLTDPKYTAVAAEFEKAHDQLGRNPSETKEAVRSVYEAVEILVKLMVDGDKISRLGKPEVEKYIKPLAQKVYVDDEIALNAANLMLGGLSEWSNSVQQYRHGQRVEEPTDPPLGLAIASISIGASYLRWLVEIDQFGN